MQKNNPDDKMVEETKTFLTHHLDFNYVKRNDSTSIYLDETTVFPGDILQLRVYGPLSAAIQWGTASYTDHVAMVVELDGQLTVVESTEPGVIHTPFNDWICQRTQPANRGGRTCPDSPYQTSNFPPRYADIVLLPLSADTRSKFNATKAVEFYKSVAGNMYGYQNFMWGWIDTPEGNWPGKLTTELFTTVLIPVLEQFAPDLLHLAAIKAFNNRLNTNYSTMADVYDELDRRSMSFADLITMPELDSYRYDGKPAMVCSDFVTQMLKTGGVFDDVIINGNEFHPRDVYELNIYETSSTGRNYPAACYADGPVNYCQLVGDYVLRFPDYNTIKPYNHMNEKCPSTYPLNRPADC